jgi:hypothetical protein
MLADYLSIFQHQCTCDQSNWPIPSWPDWPTEKWQTSFSHPRQLAKCSSMSESNYLHNLSTKLFQDVHGVVWIRLEDYKYPCQKIPLPEKYCKLALCEAHNHQFGGHNSAL